MVVLNSRITWSEHGTIMLEETHLIYQFANTFLDRIQWGWTMVNLWDMFFHG